MSTDRQTQSNRENARHSTGPTTPEGLAISSRNNFRGSGLEASRRVLVGRRNSRQPD